MTLQSTPSPGKAANDPFPLIHARILRFFSELVIDLGGRPNNLLRRVGIDPSQRPEEPDAVDYWQLVELLELSAIALDCPDFGMQLAARQSGSAMFGPLGQTMKNCATAGDVLDLVRTYSHAHSTAAGIWLKRSRSGAVTVGHDILLEGLSNKAQAMEQILLLGHLAMMELTGGKAPARRILFRHQPLSSLKTYRGYFGCEVRFAQHADATVYHANDLECAVVDRDAHDYQTALSYIEAHFDDHRLSVQAQARGIITHFLGTDLCTNDRVAAELNMHARTLHRRLAAEGTSFQQIKDGVRRDLMIYYLQNTGFDFTNVSEKLGFSEQSVMTRFCQQWFSLSPSELRRQARR